ncbi:MAG: VWA domain-containing protein [Sulfurimonas sp.]|nr:VWA domain-containing protein [Sulfurimonas sp.]
MTFLHPEFIYYMLPVLIVLFILLIMQQESLEHYFSDSVMDRLRVNSNSLTLKARNSLFFLVGVLLILALANPVLENGKVKVKSTSADIIIALDISDSMLAGDIYPNRLESAKKKALELINKATKERVGVIAFAKNSYLVSPISFDSKTVSFLLSKLDTSSITQQGTNILTMLETVAKTNANRDKKYLLILSDGGDETDFSAEIDYAKENGITVFVLGMGTEAGAPIKKRDGSFIKYNDNIIISKLNESISELATETGGVYIQNTTSSKDIEAMLHEIIKNSEHKELKSQEIKRYVALFYYPIILAMLILLIAFSSIGKKVKHSMPVSAFILFALFLSSSPSVAGMFDFKKLDDAKKLYNSKEYNSSAQIYEKYAQKNSNGQAYYNAGNAYYKEKQYEKALSAYSYAKVEDKELKANKLSNMGNALARLGTKNTLERAIKHYEASLKIKEDKLTRENLEAVKKALEENKEKSKKDDKADKDKKSKEQKTDEKGDNADEANDTKNKNKNKDSKNNDSSKSNKSDEEKNPDNKNKSDDSKSKGEGDDSDEDPSDSDEAGNAKQQAKELKDKKKEEIQKKENGGAASDSKLQGMSDAEEAKWLNKLNSKQNTYLYRLNEQKMKNKEKNEKPW